MSTDMLAAVLHGKKDIRIQRRGVPDLKPGMVRLRTRCVGICGSDLHYYQHGYCAAFIPDRPFILGHELTALVDAVAPDVATLSPNQRVTVNPTRSCGVCGYCRDGRPNLCRQVVTLGSASTKPPTDGAFAEYVCVRADQCHVLPPEMEDGLGAMIEPLAVALHAIKRSGTVSGKRVLVIGGGAIGLLVAITARAFGATPVAVSDVVPGRRAKALELGADVVLDPQAGNVDAQVRDLTGDDFDTIFEASGSPAALRQAFNFIRPGGTLVQIGTLGAEDIPLPANLVMTREINFIGSMRYANVFEEAIRLVSSGRVNLRPFISDVLPFADTARAMDLAGDKAQSLKIQVRL